MGTVIIEGLGEIEIQGNTPTLEEEQAIIEALGASTETTDISPNIENVETEELNKKELEKTEKITQEITPGMIDPNLKKVGELQGLEKLFLDRPTFEAAGAIFGALPGTPLGPAGTVAAGTAGSMAMGQLYDIVQGFLTDETTGFGTQVERATKDFQRELLLQSFFSKIPGLITGARRLVFGKGDESLYASAKKFGYPLSLSDTGNIFARGYGQVIGVFPFVGGPIKRAAAKKATLLNEKANKTLNTFAPNVTLFKLGVDMTKASRSTFDDFRIVSSFFYDDFYNAVDKVGRKTPIISTQNFKNSLGNFTKLVDDGVITLKTGEKVKSLKAADKLYNFAKKFKNYPDYISAAQHKSLIDDLKLYMGQAQQTNPGILRVLTGFKSALETDLRLLTKKSYQENLLKNVYPLAKGKRQKLDANLLSNIANKLKFADKVYANGLENSIITKTLRDKAKTEGIKLIPIPGKQTFKSPPASEFKKVDKGIFSAGFLKQGSITADELAEELLKRKASPEVFKNLKSLIGEQQFKKFVGAKLERAYSDSLLKAGKDQVGLIFDPYKLEQNLGLTTSRGREMLEIMLQSAKTKKDNPLTVEALEAFLDVAKNHAGLKIPDVSSFMARRFVLGGPKSAIGGAVMTAGTGAEPTIAVPIILLARRTSSVLSNPEILDDVIKVLDPNTPANQIKITSLKLIDMMISDSQTKQEKNDFILMKENIESIPLSEIKKGIDATINSTEEFLKFREDTEEDTEETQSIEGDTSQLPITRVPPLQTANINPNLLAQAPTGVQTLASGGNKPYSQMTNAEKLQYDRMVRGLA